MYIHVYQGLTKTPDQICSSAKFIASYCIYMYYTVCVCTCIYMLYTCTYTVYTCT